MSWLPGDGGTISSTGLYTAGPIPGVFDVFATSGADSSVTARATIQILGGDATGDYVGDVCFTNGCLTGIKMTYDCDVSSVFHPGTAACAVITSAAGILGNGGFAICTIETNGTRTGGELSGRVTVCPFSQVGEDTFEIDGSVRDGRLVFTVSLSNQPLARYEGRKT